MNKNPIVSNESTRPDRDEVTVRPILIIIHGIPSIALFVPWSRLPDKTVLRPELRSDLEMIVHKVVFAVIANSSCFCEVDSKVRFEAKSNAVDAENYDYRSKRSYLTKPNNLIESVIHMLMCGLGGGLVALHVAYMKCGMCSGMIFNIIISALVGYCVCILVWSAQKLYGRVEKHELTYPDVMEAAMVLSPWPKLRNRARGFRYLVEATLFCHLYGSCCVHIIMIARNLKELITGSDVVNYGEPQIKVIVFWLIIPCFVISMVTDMKCFAPFALICDLFGVSLVLLTLWYSLHDVNDIQASYNRPLKSIAGLVEFSCLCIFVLEPVCYALPIENSMKEPKKFHVVVLSAMPIHTVAMMAVGFFGYWYCGDYSEAPITMQFPFSPFAVTVKVFLCISLIVVYALYFFLAFDIIWFYIRRRYALSRYWFWERVHRTLHVVILVVISNALSFDVIRVMGIIGALSTAPAIFIYPPFINLLVNWEHPGLGRCNWRLMISTCIILLGISVTVAGTYYNVAGFIAEKSSNHTPSFKTQKVATFWGRRSANSGLNGSDLEYKNVSFKEMKQAVSDFKNFSLLPTCWNPNTKNLYGPS